MKVINLDTKLIAIICFIVLVIFGLYFLNFHYSLSKDNGDWGTFGDYVGGILNPIIAAFAFYLIAKTYDLQKRELDATRSLLELSTDAQKKQVELAVLTALLNVELMRLDMHNSEFISLSDRRDENNIKILSILNDDEKERFNNIIKNQNICIETKLEKIDKNNEKIKDLENRINNIFS